MRHTLWMHDRQIGETEFELSKAGRRRAGMFHPTEFGLGVLPGLTAMFPALLAFGELCRREGLDVHDGRPEAAAAAMDAFGGTPEGQRVIAAAKQLATVVVRDPDGVTLPWESLAISDLGALSALAHEKRTGKPPEEAGLPVGSGAYVVSLTLSVRRDRALTDPQHLGPKRRQTAPN